MGEQKVDNPLVKDEFLACFRAIVAAKGISVREVGRQMESIGAATGAAVSRWHSGEYGPNVSKLPALAKALGVPKAALIDMTHAQPVIEQLARQNVVKLPPPTLLEQLRWDQAADQAPPRPLLPPAASDHK